MADAQPQPIDGVVDEHHTMATHTQQRHRDEDEHTRASFRLPSTITLDPTNYHGWARQMQAMLEYGGMWELVRPCHSLRVNPRQPQGLPHSKK